MNNIILMDSAVETSLWEKSNDKKPVWTYVKNNPEIVRELIRENIKAGSKIILTDTFEANKKLKT